ncbi:hypothetical protein AYX13_06867 [Cryptococcus neoformans]|nr:hypothetical protein AYX13_06867 [Cryptococcus neoformans var. grubii]
MQFQQIFSLLAVLAVPTNAYFILSHPILETTRLDPIVSPGEISSHVHAIVGGNNFDKAMTYQSTQESTCSTASITVDKSNYWTPQLYYYNPADESYEMISVSYVNTYYLPRYSSGQDTVQAFPDGLRMISGDPFRREYVDGDPDSAAITYVCLDYDNDHSGDADWAERNSFFNHNCPNGMRAQVFFRSCWDGVNLDSNDHKSHMAWPSGGVDGGDCPSTHPVRLVSLFYEFIYNVQDFPFNGAGNVAWVFATGDTTGYSMHGDFVNGWPSLANGTNVLQEALDQCNQDNGVGGELNNCPPFVPYIDSASASACKPLNLLVDEDIGDGHSISKLPGDNPLWIGNGTKPVYPNYTDDGIGFTDFKSVIPDGYTEVGCIAESTTGRALTGSHFTASNMTRGVCVSFCEANGYPLAGIEYADECYCDFEMRNGASNTTLLASEKCNLACAANSNENCGGSSTLTLFNNPSLYSAPTYPTGWTSYGCMTEATNERALAKYSFSSSSMTPQLCMSTCQAEGYIYSGTEYSTQCYCANSFSAGSAAADESSCSMACGGDKLQTCGGSDRLTTFKFDNNTASSRSSITSSANTSVAANGSTLISAVSSTSSTSSTTLNAITASTSSISPNSATSLSTYSYSGSSTTSSLISTSASASTSSSSVTTVPWASALSSQYLGCYSDYTPRHLNGTSYTSTTSMTNEACVSFCTGKGYAFAGTEYAQECHCGDYLNTSVKRNENRCITPCTGDVNEMCGNGGLLNVYDTGLGNGIYMAGQYSKRSFSAKFRL